MTRQVLEARTRLASCAIAALNELWFIPLTTATRTVALRVMLRCLKCLRSPDAWRGLLLDDHGCLDQLSQDVGTP